MEEWTEKFKRRRTIGVILLAISLFIGLGIYRHFTTPTEPQDALPMLYKSFRIAPPQIAHYFEEAIAIINNQ